MAVPNEDSVMSVLRRGNSKYWYIQFQFLGRTYIKSSRTISKKVAEQMELEWRAKLHAQQCRGEKASITLAEALTTYCETKRGTPNHSNLLGHSRTIQRILPADRLLEDIETTDIENYRRQREQEGIGPKTLKHGLDLIRCALKYAGRLGYRVPDVEFRSVRLPRHRLRYLSIEEEQKLLRELDPNREGAGLKPVGERDPELIRNLQDTYDLVVLLLDTGARYSEIANIAWNQIRLDERVINLWRSKVQNQSELFMTERVHRILCHRASNADGPYVFRNRNGRARGYCTQSIRKAIRRAGLHDCTIHTLRHTYASRLIQNGLSVYEVKEMLGHTDIKTTLRYAHLERRDVATKAREIIERLRDPGST